MNTACAWEAEDSNFECWLSHNEAELRAGYEGECKDLGPLRQNPFKEFAWQRYLERVK